MLGRMCSNFIYIPTLSRPQSEPLPWPGESGYVQDLWRKRTLSDRWPEPPSPENTHLFLCGNPSMTVSMTELLLQEGFQEHTKKTPGQIHAEKYW